MKNIKKKFDLPKNITNLIWQIFENSAKNYEEMKEVTEKLENPNDEILISRIEELQEKLDTLQSDIENYLNDNVNPPPEQEFEI